jgi:hypothetical protein
MIYAIWQEFAQDGRKSVSVVQAAIKLRDLIRPKGTGEPVNIHVVQQVKVPQPDFDAMQRIIEQPIGPVSVPPPKTIHDDSSR